tara:strand:- start:319 stop:534 length:216 start_codon:yes stop_codon:yes gene_type:complete
MQIKIGNLKIDFENRTSKHKNYLFKEIYTLRNEIVELVLIGHSKNRIPIAELKRKASLIKKYSRRLKLLST